MQVFKSKIDWWILCLILLPIVLSLLIVLSVFGTQDGGWDQLAKISWVAGLFILFAFLLPVWLLLSTRYRIESGVLRIISGPFRWTIPLESITAVENTRSPLSSPALSLDRLKIHYGNGRWVMVSPSEQEAFLRAIGQSHRKP